MGKNTFTVVSNETQSLLLYYYYQLVYYFPYELLETFFFPHPLWACLQLWDPCYELVSVSSSLYALIPSNSIIMIINVPVFLTRILCGSVKLLIQW